MKTYNDLVTFDVENLPTTVKKFLQKTTPLAHYTQTWSYYSHAYGRGFELLVEQALRYSNSDYLMLPVFFLGRHSIELALKETISEYSKYTNVAAQLEGHSLITLYDQMNTQFLAAGFDQADDWTAYCRKLIAHLHDVDPDGDRFRYPVSRKGDAFEYTFVELQGLVNAHWALTLHAECAVDMLHETREFGTY